MKRLAPLLALATLAAADGTEPTAKRTTKSRCPTCQRDSLMPGSGRVVAYCTSPRCGHFEVARDEVVGLAT